METVELPKALEIIAHPEDLDFLRTKDSFCISRGPGGNYKLIISSEDFPKAHIKNPIEFIEGLLKSFVKTVECELKNGGDFCHLLNPYEKSIEDLHLLKGEDVKRITEGISKKYHFSTYA